MSKNKFDRAPATDSIPEISVPSSVSEFSVPSSIPEVSVPEINSETEKPIKVRVNDEGRVYAEGYKSVRLRKAPNENAEVITTIPVGENIIFGDTVNGWTKVKWSSFSGWMMDKYVIDHR